MAFVVALLAFIGMCWWLAVNVSEGAYTPMIAGILFLPFAIWGAWISR